MKIPNEINLKLKESYLDEVPVAPFALVVFVMVAELVFDFQLLESFDYVVDP